jgi:hypothetical protein
MAKKTFQKHELVRPHALNGCTLYPLDSDGNVDIATWKNMNKNQANWRSWIHLRGFEPLLIEDGEIIKVIQPNYQNLWNNVDFVRVNHCGTVYGARTTSLSRISRSRNA